MKLIMRHDLRSAPFGAPHPELYSAALDQAAWAEEVGFDTVMTHEHHCEDGYVPSPLLFAAAIAGRTRKIHIEIRIALLPLYDPIRMAEDWAVLDLVSRGRADVVISVGYRRYEFALFGIDYDDRGRIMDESVAIIKKAWTGEPFEYRGQTVRISPRPFRQPRPPIYFGGNSPAAARRAAREGEGFFPPPNSKLIEYYQAECARHGKPPGEVSRMDQNGNIVFVSEDVDRDWEEVGKYLLYAHNSYGKFAEEVATQTAAAKDWPYRQPASTHAELRAAKSFIMATPEECVRMAKESGVLVLHPLAGGVPPELSWRSLKLFETQVLPQLEV
jgi:alkanesulfonate monooxygenase SsuD/methylene tetrahydromethanopterin reductase-like flavin-dependent oxidoreductase (luciferase family)